MGRSIRGVADSAHMGSRKRAGAEPNGRSPPWARVCHDAGVPQNPVVKVWEYFTRMVRWSRNGRMGSKERRSVTRPSFQTT